MALVKSFLALSKPGQNTRLAEYIRSFHNCEVVSPESKDKLLVVVMENADQASETRLLEELHKSTSLEHMVLVSSLTDTNENEE